MLPHVKELGPKRFLDLNFSTKKTSLCNYMLVHYLIFVLECIVSFSFSTSAFFLAVLCISFNGSYNGWRLYRYLSFFEFVAFFCLVCL
jgi:hypothetical protein